MRHYCSLLCAMAVLVAGWGCVLAADATTATTATTPATASVPPGTPDKPLTTVVVLTGKFTHIAAPKKADGVLTAILNTETDTVQVELAPQSYLDKIGVALKENDTVTLTGLQHMKSKDQTIVVSVQVMKLGEKTCQLRDAENKNKPMWLPCWKNVKVTGTVKALKTPPETATGDARLVSCTLVTDTTPQTVLLAPAEYLTKIGLGMKEGDTVTISGSHDIHTEQSPLLAHKVKWQGVSYLLRDKKQHGAWETETLPKTANPETPIAAPAK